MIYRLKQPWALRGYPDILMCLDRLGSVQPVQVLTLALFNLLTRCDGEQDWTPEDDVTRQVLDRYREMGILETVEVPTPVMFWQKYRFIENRRVPQSFISITGRCNLRCLHCFMATDTNPHPNEFTLEQMKHIFDELDECGVHALTISGGEPLCHPNFAGILEDLSRHGMEIYRFFTNGILFNPNIVDLLKKYHQNPEIVFSFDGLGCHDWMRNRPGAEKEVVRAIRLAHESGFRVRCAMNVNYRSLPVLLESSRFLYDEGVRSIYFVRTSDAPKWFYHGEGCLTAEEYWDAILMLLEGLVDLNRKGLELQFFNGYTLPAGITAEQIEGLELPRPENFDRIHAWCHKAMNSLFISSTGRILPCDGSEGAMLENGVMAQDCNILQRPLKEILSDSEYSRCLQMSIADVMKANPECADCRWARRCHGSACRVCGTLWRAAASGDEAYFKRPGAIDLTLKGPLSCVFYRKGYYDRMIRILKDHPV